MRTIEQLLGHTRTNEPSGFLWFADRVSVLLLIALLMLGGVLTPAAQAQQGQPKRLVVALEEDPPLINPAITTVISSYVVGSTVYSAMTRTMKDGSLQPELAEKWEMSPDGKSYTFYLRKGVTWHDGKPFTSADVKFSVEQALSKLQPFGRQVYAAVEKVDTPDEHTVVFRLKQVFAPFLSGSDLRSSAILPKHIFEGTDLTKAPANQQPVGTGPFKFKEWVKGDHITFVKNDKYYKPGKPKVDELVFKIIPQSTTRAVAFEKGEVDVLYFNALPVAEARRLGGPPNGGTVITTQGGSAYLGIMNTREKPLSDVKVRKAIAHAIDRGFIQKTVNDGFVEPMVGPLPPSLAMYNKNLKDYEFSPAKANALLDEAGYPKGADGTRFTLDFLWPGQSASYAQIVDITKVNLGAVGIKVNSVPLERAALTQRAYIDNKFGMVMDSYGLGPEPAIGTERLYTTANIKTPPVPFTNSAGFSNPEVDRLFAEEKIQTDPAKRKQIYDRIQEIIWDQVPILPFFSLLNPNIYRANYVGGAIFAGLSASQEPYEDVEVIVPGAQPAAKPAAAPAQPAVAAAPKPAATAAPAPAPAGVPETGGTAAVVWVVGAVVVVGIAIGGYAVLRRR